jgi:hypothetical protein
VTTPPVDSTACMADARTVSIALLAGRTSTSPPPRSHRLLLACFLLFVAGPHHLVFFRP